MTRRNNDNKNNTSGKLLCELCNANNICIINGRYGTDRSGPFTCFNHNGGKSSIDYGIVSPKLFDNLNDFQVHEFDNLLSDTHCAISLSFNYMPHENGKEQIRPDNSQQFIDNEDKGNNQEFIFKWNGTKPDEFNTSFNVEDIESLIQTLMIVSDSPNQQNISNYYSNLSQIIIEKAVHVGAYVVSKKKTTFKKDKDKQPWFNESCFRSRENYYRVRNKMKFINPEARSERIKAASKKLKDTIKNTKKLYFKRLLKRLLELSQQTIWT